jgi:Ca2+-binding RTX toxin-like protein
MRSRTHSWTNTLTKLGFTRKWRKKIAKGGYNRVLRLESLENRQLLAADVTVGNINDIVNGTTTSIAALISSPGADGISLREAILAANATNGANSIEFAIPGTITLTQGQLTISDDLTIQGLGSDDLIIDGDENGRVLYVDSGDEVTIEDLTVTGGSVGGLAFGGGIYNAGDLTLENVAVEGNYAGSIGGGIFSQGTLTLEQVSLIGNDTDGVGGGLYASGSLEIVASSIEQNTAAEAGAGAAVYTGGSGTFQIDGSTFADNIAEDGSGNGYGGGLVVTGDTTAASLYITNSTFSNNEADGNSGGIRAENNAGLIITNSTITENTAHGEEGGITSDASIILVQNSIIAGNISEDDSSVNDAAGVFHVSSRSNLVGNSTNAHLSNPSKNTIIGTADPLLSDLGEHGGPTRTQYPLPNSPAINAGNNSYAWDFLASAALATDQRGQNHNRINGTTVDMGAVEANVVQFSDGNVFIYGTEGDDIIRTHADLAVFSNFSTSGTLLPYTITSVQAWGYGGNDEIRSTSVSSTATYSVTYDGGAGHDTLVGTRLDNTMLGGDGNDTIEIRGGEDTSDGGAGDDVYLFTDANIGLTDYLAEIEDSSGSDTLDFSKMKEAISVDLGDGAVQDTGIFEIDLFSGAIIENVRGTRYGDVIVGNSLNNRLEGGHGNDSVEGETGNDQLEGGHGDDTYVFQGASDLGDDLVLEKTGQGSDTLDFNGLTTAFGLNIDLSASGGQIVTSFGLIDLDYDDDPTVYRSIENVVGTEEADTITGTSANNRLEGRGGDDTIFGGDGDDFLNGGDGNDELFGEGGNDHLDGRDDTNTDILTGSGDDFPRFVDNGQTGFTTSGTWSTATGDTFGSDQHIADANGTNSATWTFSSLPTDSNFVFGVYVSWDARTDGANTTFSIKSGGNTLFTSGSVNQAVDPTDVVVEGQTWKFLATIDASQIVDDELTVELSSTSQSGKKLIADAVRLVGAGPVTGDTPTPGNLRFASEPEDINIGHLQWDLPSNNTSLNGYEIQISANGLDAWQLFERVGNTTQQIANLAATEPRYYRIRSLEFNEGHSYWSVPIKVTDDVAVVDDVVKLGAETSIATGGSGPEASVALTWSIELEALANTWSVARREMGSQSWVTIASSIMVEDADPPSLNFQDSNVDVGVTYEYRVTHTTPSDTFVGIGFVVVGVAKPVVDSRGTVILIVDSTQVEPLAYELARFTQDLIGDGWSVITKTIEPDPDDLGTSVAAVKSLIQAEYNYAPESVKSVILIGDIPVPYSGESAPDGHTPRTLPADAFYGDVEFGAFEESDLWTDDVVDLVDTSTVEDGSVSNTPEDGRFDRNDLPDDGNGDAIELAVGRIDFSNLSYFESDPAFVGLSSAQVETALLKRYFDKDHAFRHGEFVVNYAANVAASRADFNTADAWLNYSPLVGEGNINLVNWLATMDNPTMGAVFADARRSSPTSNAISFPDGIDDDTEEEGFQDEYTFTRDLVGRENYNIFTRFSSSYTVNWEKANDLMSGILAQEGQTLTATWIRHDHRTLQHLGTGATMGEAHRNSQNNVFGAAGHPDKSWFSLLGDPTLRMHVIAPPKHMVATSVGGGTQTALNWTASADESDPGFDGYRVYSRLAGTNNAFEYVPGSQGTDTNFTDNEIPGTYEYMVRAVKLESTTSGSYYNLSQGAFSTEAPSVTNVIINSNAGGNYSNIPYEFNGVVGSGEQLRTVPVGAANIISVQFTEDVTIASSDLDLIALNRYITEPTATNFVEPSSANNYTATWTLSSALPSAQYLLRLADTIVDAGGNQLDGEWTNPGSLASTGTSQFPSGDYVEGGDFEFVFTILPGDMNRDNKVTNSDTSLYTAALTNPSSLAAAIVGLADVNLNGSVSSADTSPYVDLLSGPAYLNDLALLAIVADMDGDFDVDDDDTDLFTDYLMASDLRADINNSGSATNADIAPYFKYYNFGIDLDIL